MEEYLKSIEQFVNLGQTPSDTDFFEFSLVPLDVFHDGMGVPHSYTKRALSVKQYLTQEKTVFLHEIADILQPKRIEKQQKVFMSDLFTYPIRFDAVRENTVSSDVYIQKGDILVGYLSDVLLVDREPTEQISVHPGFKVIRPQSEISEYLYLYLKSDTALCLLRALSRTPDLSIISNSNLANLPIILPPREIEQYRKVFNLIAYGGNSISDYIEISAALSGEWNSLESILSNELSRNLISLKNQNIRELISSDINEVKRCFQAKAYKATIVLIGSILETYLTDWLGEIHNKDYFRYRYRLEDGRVADLKDIIDAIGDIKYPDWLQECENAHEIRNMRNSIHSTYLLNRQLVLNEDTCKRMIDYLEEIVHTRLGR